MLGSVHSVEASVGLYSLSCYVCHLMGTLKQITFDMQEEYQFRKEESSLGSADIESSFYICHIGKGPG